MEANGVTGGQDLAPGEERDLRAELGTIRAEHADLDAAIAAISATDPGNTMTLQRLKKRKLALKDRISEIEDRLLPDIIA